MEAGLLPSPWVVSQEVVIASWPTEVVTQSSCPASLADRRVSGENPPPPTGGGYLVKSSPRSHVIAMLCPRQTQPIPRFVPAVLFSISCVLLLSASKFSWFFLNRLFPPLPIKANQRFGLKPLEPLKPLERLICINPSKPVIALSNFSRKLASPLVLAAMAAAGGGGGVGSTCSVLPLQRLLCCKISTLRKIPAPGKCENFKCPAMGKHARKFAKRRDCFLKIRCGKNLCASVCEKLRMRLIVTLEK